MPSNESTSHVEIELADGRTARIDVPEGETLLNAAEDAGYELNFSCREGRCTTCTGRLLEGEVTYLEPPKAVDEDKREAGFVSLCIAGPDGDCRLEVGDDVLLDAFPNVWKHLESND